MYIHIHKYFLIPTWIKHASTIRNSTDIAFLKYIIYLTYLINKKGRVIHNASNQLPPKNVEFLFNFLKHASYTTGRPVGVSAEHSMIGC